MLDDTLNVGDNSNRAQTKESPMEIVISIKVPIEIKKRRKWYVAFCPVLDVGSQGETEVKAIKNLKEALRLFLVTCIEHGTLDDVLKDCGFEFKKRRQIKTKVSSEKLRNIQVPLPYFQTKGDCHCHA